MKQLRKNHGKQEQIHNVLQTAQTVKHIVTLLTPLFAPLVALRPAGHRITVQ